MVRKKQTVRQVLELEKFHFLLTINPLFPEVMKLLLFWPEDISTR